MSAIDTTATEAVQPEPVKAFVVMRHNDMKPVGVSLDVNRALDLIGELLTAQARIDNANHLNSYYIEQVVFG